MTFSATTDHLIHVTDSEIVLSPEEIGQDIIENIEAELKQSVAELTVGDDAAEINPDSGLNAFRRAVPVAVGQDTHAQALQAVEQ